jgi:hypothetical protein
MFMESQLYDVDALMVFTKTKGFTYADLSGRTGARKYIYGADDFLTPNPR